MGKTFSLFTVIIISSILIGSVSIGSMVFADDKYSTYKKEPTKHPQYVSDSKFDKNNPLHDSYLSFTDDDSVLFDSKRHHPRAIEDMTSYNDSITQFRLINDHD